MKKERVPKVGIEEIADDFIQVEIVGATLVAQAVRELIQTQSGFDVVEDAAKTLIGPRVVLILGQDGMAVFQRRRLRSPRRRRPERFALLTNGCAIDFRLARDLPIRAFIGTDDPVPVFLQGLRAAAAGVNFCSPQIVPFLLAATSSPRGETHATEMLPTVSTTPLHHVARDQLKKYSGAQTAESMEGKDGASEEMCRAKQRGLSDREAGIALQAARGMSNQQIADANNVTLSTVKFHLYRVYQKLGIERRSQLSILTMNPENETLV